MNRIGLLLASATLLLNACAANTEAVPTPTRVPRAVAPIKQTYDVQRGEVVSRIQFTGRIMPVTQVELAFEVDGRVRNVYVEEGDTVTAGQVVADLTSLEGLEKQKAAGELALRQAALELENAELELELTRRSADGDTREIELEIRQNNVELAQARYDAVALDVQNVDDAIADARLIVPFDGQVLTLNIEAGSNVAEFRPVMLVADVTALEVGALVQSSRLVDLAEGMPVLIEASNNPNIELEGTIRRLPYQSGTVASGDPMLRVAMDTPAQEVGLALDDQVEVTVVVAEKDDVIWLPVQAVRTFQDNTFVVVREDDVERRVDVITGIEGGSRIEIVSGLEVGQIVVGP